MVSQLLGPAWWEPYGRTPLDPDDGRWAIAMLQQRFCRQFSLVEKFWRVTETSQPPEALPVSAVALLQRLVALEVGTLEPNEERRLIKLANEVEGFWLKHYLHELLRAELVAVLASIEEMGRELRG